MNPCNLVLIGYRACGKTSVGRVLSRLLGRPLVDLDEVVETEAGETIAELVAREGWEAFRRRERDVVARFAAAPGLILATGGGVVLDPENVQRLRDHGFVIWLTAPAETIQARLAAHPDETGKRPALQGADSLREVATVLEQRLPLYQAAADLELDTTGAEVETLARRIVAIFSAQEGGHGR